MRAIQMWGCFLSVAVGAAAPAAADVVQLRSGGRVTGVILQQTGESVTIDAGPGRLTLPMTQVARIVPGRSPLQDWRERSAALSPRDAQGWAALARWAEQNRLDTQAREAWEHVVAVNSSSAEANEALHRVQVNGRWVSEEEGYRARGWVEYMGHWMAPAERDERLREQAAEEAQEMQRHEALLRAREAEARLREAEARARSAESMGGQPDQYAVPYGYGYDGSYGYAPYASSSYAPYAMYQQNAGQLYSPYLGYVPYPYSTYPFGDPFFSARSGSRTPFFGRIGSLPRTSINARPLRLRGTTTPPPPTTPSPSGALFIGPHPQSGLRLGSASHH